jgi:hypothetical protein
VRRLLLALPLLVTGCADDDGAAPASTAAPPTTQTTTTTSVATSTTPSTEAQARTPRPTAREAVDALLLAWRAGDRDLAADVADQRAVETLFAIAPEAPEDRGCNDPPAGGATYCVYRLDAGELQVRATPRGGGFVVDVVILGSP